MTLAYVHLQYERSPYALGFPLCEIVYLYMCDGVCPLLYLVLQPWEGGDSHEELRAVGVRTLVGHRLITAQAHTSHIQITHVRLTRHGISIDTVSRIDMQRCGTYAGKIAYQHARLVV